MKTNLKNYPVKSTPQAYERWMKNFTKELQQHPVIEIEKLHSTSFATALIKEILGE